MAIFFHRGVSTFLLAATLDPDNRLGVLAQLIPWKSLGIVLRTTSFSATIGELLAKSKLR